MIAPPKTVGDVDCISIMKNTKNLKAAQKFVDFMLSTEAQELMSSIDFTIPVNPNVHNDYAQQLTDKLAAVGFRIQNDNRNEKLGYRLREAQIKKVPVQIIVGDNEVNNSLVTFRRHGSKDSETVSVDKFIEMMQNEIAQKK